MIGFLAQNKRGAGVCSDMPRVRPRPAEVGNTAVLRRLSRLRLRSEPWLPFY